MPDPLRRQELFVFCRVAAVRRAALVSGPVWQWQRAEGRAARHFAKPLLATGGADAMAHFALTAVDHAFAPCADRGRVVSNLAVEALHLACF